MNYTDMTKEQLFSELNEMQQRLSHLEVSEKQCRDTLDSIGDAISIQDTDFKILYQNQAAKDIIGNHAGEFCYRAYEHKETVCRDCSVALTFQDGMRHTLEKKMDVQGKTIYVEINSSPLRDETGKIIAAIEAIRDITNRRKSEEALRLAESKFRILVEQSLVGIYIIQDNRFPYVNPKTADIFGYTPEEVISAGSIDDLIYEEDRRTVRDNIRKRIQNGVKTIRYSFRGKRKDGAVIEVEVQGSSTEFNGKPAIIGTVLDITDRKKIEAELVKTEELKSLSAFASGVAHEYNNLLTAIIGNLSLAKMYAKPGYEVYDVLAEAEKASIRAKGLTLQLLTFADGSRAAKKIICLKDPLKDWFHSALKNSQVKPVFFIQENLLPVEADIQQLHQVIDVIVTNTLQSMPGGGVIKVKAENMDIDSPSELPLEKGNYVLISIEDKGTGLPENVLRNIFDPLNPTIQQSIGLGLATSYSIIKKHNGHITVDSKQGVGTIFNIYLPAFHQKHATSAEKQGEYPSGKGRILIMDDEEIVRLVLGKLLSQCGYESEPARSGEEMLRMYKAALESRHPFDAVIMDLVIEGGMGGQEAIKYLMELDPNVKAIVSSGYSNAPVMSHANEFGFLGFLAKPYRLEELANVLNEVLTGNKA